MIEKARAPVDAPLFSGWFVLDDNIRGEFSDNKNLACSIEEKVGNTPTILLGQNYAWKEPPRPGLCFSGKLLSLPRMELTQEQAKQLVTVLNHFIEHGHLR